MDTIGLLGVGAGIGLFAETAGATPGQSAFAAVATSLGVIYLNRWFDLRRDRDRRAAQVEDRERLLRHEAELARLRAVAGKADVQIQSNKAAAAAAQGMASASLDASRSGLFLPEKPATPPVPGTNWPLCLVVEDDPRASKSLVRMMAGRSFRVHHAPNMADATECLDDVPSVALIDYQLPDGTGSDVLWQIRERGLGTRAFIFTGSVMDDAVRDGLLGLGAEAVIVKGPEGRAELMRRIGLPASG